MRRSLATLELLEHLADALDALVVLVAEALLHEPAQGVVEVAVVQEVVGDLREDVVRVEIEPGLGPVPLRIVVPGRHLAGG